MSAFSVIATWLILTRKKRKKKRELRSKIKSENNTNEYSQMARNTVLNISRSKELYMRLITQTHPDRFTNDMKVTATELSQRITEAKHNYSELVEIEIEVNKFLNK